MRNLSLPVSFVVNLKPMPKNSLKSIYFENDLYKMTIYFVFYLCSYQLQCSLFLYLLFLIGICSFTYPSGIIYLVSECLKVFFDISSSVALSQINYFNVVSTKHFTLPLFLIDNFPKHQFLEQHYVSYIKDSFAVSSLGNVSEKKCTTLFFLLFFFFPT